MKPQSHLRGLLLVAAGALQSISSQAQSPAQYKLAEYRIMGAVFDESHQAVEKVRVCARPLDNKEVPGFQCTLSNANGSFLIRTGWPGQYRILAEKSDAGYHSQQLPFYIDPALPVVDVTVSEANKSATVSLSLGEKNGALVGHLADATTGYPVESARFSMCHVSNPSICYNAAVKDSEGAFDLATPHVPFTLRIVADGYEEWWGSNGSGRNNPISVAPGTKVDMSGALRRRPDVGNRPLSEREKQPGINLPAPTLISPADRLELDYYPRHTRLEWQIVEGAAYYLVEIDYCESRDRQRRECVNPVPFSPNPNGGPIKTQETSFEFNFVGAQPGRWRVWAVDDKGQEGFKSPWRIFFYLK